MKLVIKNYIMPVQYETGEIHFEYSNPYDINRYGDGVEHEINTVEELYDFVFKARRDIVSCKVGYTILSVASFIVKEGEPYILFDIEPSRFVS